MAPSERPTADYDALVDRVAAQVFGEPTDENVPEHAAHRAVVEAVLRAAKDEQAQEISRLRRFRISIKVLADAPDFTDSGAPVVAVADLQDALAELDESRVIPPERTGDE